MISQMLTLLPISVLVTIFVVFFANYVVLEYLNPGKVLPDIALYIATCILFYSLYGYIISLTASYGECRKTNHLNSVWSGIKLSLYAIVTYLVIYFVKPVVQPFNELFGNNKLGDSLGQIFFLGISISIGSLITYFNSTDTNCKLLPAELETNLKELDKYLNQPFEEETTNTITVTD